MHFVLEPRLQQFSNDPNLLVVNREVNDPLIDEFESRLKQVADLAAQGKYDEVEMLLTDEKFLDKLDLNISYETKLFSQDDINRLSKQEVTVAYRDAIADPFRSPVQGRVTFGDFIDLSTGQKITFPDHVRKEVAVLQIEEMFHQLQKYKAETLGIPDHYNSAAIRKSLLNELEIAIFLHQHDVPLSEAYLQSYNRSRLGIPTHITRPPSKRVGIFDPSKLSLEQQYRVALDSLPGIRDSSYSLSERNIIEQNFEIAGLPRHTRERIAEEIINQKWGDILGTKETFLSLIYDYDFEIPTLSPSAGVWDGVRGWWQRTVGGLNFRGLGNDQVTTNQEIPNITRLTSDENIAVPAGLLDNNVGQANPKFTETDSTISQDLPPRKVTSTVIEDAIDSSLPTAIKTGRNISPALPLAGVFALGLTDYIAEEIFGIDLLDFSQNTQTKSIGVKLNEILLPTLDIANEPEKNSQNQNISYNPSAQNESAIAPVFSTQSNSEFSDVLIYTSDGPRPFRLIGCGPTAVSNILNQLGLAGMSPLQIAQMVDTQDWGYYGTNVLQDSSLIKILRQYGINPVQYTNSLQFSLANDTNTGDILLVGAKFRYNGGTIDHISYMQIQSDGRIKLMDNFMITDAYCTPTDNSTLSCKNSKGESLTIDVTNMPIYLIDNTQKAVIPQIPLDRKTTVTGGGTTNISYADQNSAITNGFIYFNQKDPQWQDLPTYGDTTVANKGCGIMTGAMVTGTNPEVYYEAYRRYQQSQGNVDLLTNSGTNFNVHMAVLKDIGCDTIPIAGSFEEIKDQVEKYTDSGTPVWVNAEIYGYGHNAMATGVDENRNLILNDPWRSENTAVEDRYIKDRPETPWRFSAVVCEN